MDIIVILILAIVVIIALMGSMKHFKGGGGCCGGGGKAMREKKTLSSPVIGEKILTLDGLHCENCEIKVENALNRIDGVLAKVERKKKRATVSFSKEVSDETLKERVERLGYKVIAIEEKK